MKVFVVEGLDGFTGCWLDSVFKNKEQAERRAERYNKDEENIELGHHFHVTGVDYYEND